MANDRTYAITVNSDGNISYPKNFISANNIAQFGNDVSGVLKDLTLDGVSKIRVYDKKTQTWTDTYKHTYLEQDEHGSITLVISNDYPVVIESWKIKGSNGKKYDNIQTAIDEVSVYGGEVWIAAGTYKHGSAMTMKNNVAIYGGFAGTETSKEERVEGNETILDGEGKYRVFNNDYTEDNPLTNSAKLDNVTIQNGYVSGSNVKDVIGAGMYNYYASPEITNCTFTNNSAKSSGGGIHNNSSSPTLTNCTFSGNSAGYYGSGMHNESSSSPVLTNCTFSNNHAEYYGGGMNNQASSPTLTNCTFSNNSTQNAGGGMYNQDSNPKLTNCTFTNNSATDTSDYGHGGGMYNGNSSSPVLTNCILWGNTAINGNEIYNNDSYSKPTIDTCILPKNEYSGEGTYNIITLDPLLQPLADNGGYVETCAVAEGSSAIGAGKVVEGVTTDARGVARSSTPTIGAYEYTK